VQGQACDGRRWWLLRSRKHHKAIDFAVGLDDKIRFRMRLYTSYPPLFPLNSSSGETTPTQIRQQLRYVSELSGRSWKMILGFFTSYYHSSSGSRHRLSPLPCPYKGSVLLGKAWPTNMVRASFNVIESSTQPFRILPYQFPLFFPSGHLDPAKRASPRTAVRSPSLSPREAIVGDDQAAKSI
jgi:hypothetical protein